MENIQDILHSLHIQAENTGSATGMNWLSADSSTERISSYSPVDGKLLGKVSITTESEYHHIVETAQQAFLSWRNLPAPKRGEIVRQIGEKLRAKKAPLGALVSYEMGKSYQEGLGEVQEMIDICDFAVGLSRQLYGLMIQSERPDHRMYEHWQPLGVIGIISAFNFPVAVWSWNAILAAICGNTCIWKPSEKTPLSAVAVQHIIAEVIKENNLPEGVFCLINGDYKVGEWMAKDERIPLISATGSVRMGKKLAPVVAERLGRSLLELGGNNAIILTESADQDMALRAVAFGAVGTAGQRCTTTRRLIIHESIYDNFTQKLVNIFNQLKIGNPLEEGVLVGPLIDKLAVEAYSKAIVQAQAEGGKLLTGGKVLEGSGYESGCYVQPAIIEARPEYKIVQEETFAPILYLLKYSSFDEAIGIQNGVRQGLSSSVFTINMREAEEFLSVRGSDCGIANVNIGTSGAEIGGAFGGEKETGGGREAGTDSWKAYMRRQTTTINYGNTLPLAQGITFTV